MILFNFLTTISNELFGTFTPIILTQTLYASNEQEILQQLSIRASATPTAVNAALDQILTKKTWFTPLTKLSSYFNSQSDKMDILRRTLSLTEGAVGTLYELESIFGAINKSKK